MSGPAHRVDGLALAVEDQGEGAPVLFQHGLCGDARQTADVFPHGTGFRLITLECRGHGGSEAGDPAGFGIARFADDVADLVEARRLGPLVVGGLSMGAAIALRLAVRRPDLVRALVLARPAWRTEAAPDNMRPNGLVGDLLARFPPAEARARFEASETARRLRAEAPDNLASLLGFFSREPVAVTAELLRRIAADGPGVTEREVALIAVPTLVIGHERDLIHPLAYAESLAALVPGARLVRVTPKAENRERHTAEVRAALQAFLPEIAP